MRHLSENFRSRVLKKSATVTLSAFETDRESITEFGLNPSRNIVSTTCQHPANHTRVCRYIRTATVNGLSEKR